MHYNISLWNNQVAWLGSDFTLVAHGTYDPRNLSGTNFFFVEQTVNTGSGTWDFVSYNLNGTTNSLNPASSYAFAANSDSLYIGSQIAWPYTSAGYNGWIREIIIWSRKLTWSERSNVLYYATSY